MLVIQRRSAPQLRTAAARVSGGSLLRAGAPGGGQGQRASSLDLNLESLRSYSSSPKGSVLASSSSRTPSSFAPRSATSLLRFNSTAAISTEPTPTPTPTPSSLGSNPSLPSESKSTPSSSSPYPTRASALDAIASFQTLSPPATPKQYEELLSVLTQHSSKSDLKPLVPPAISVYKQMVELKVEPTQTSISNLILLLCSHDKKLNKVYLPQQAQPVDPTAKGSIAVSDRPNLAFSSAVALFRAALPRHLERKSVTFDTDVYEALLLSSVLHRDPQTAREIYLEMDKQSQQEREPGRSNVKITAIAVQSLINAFAFTNAGAVKVAFEAFRGKEGEGSLLTSQHSRQMIWIAAMKAYLLCGDVKAAEELFTQVVTAPRPPPVPASASSSSPVPEETGNNTTTPTDASIIISSDTPTSSPSSSSEAESPIEPANPPPSSSSSSPSSLDASSSTSIKPISAPNDLSPTPSIASDIALKAIFNFAPDQAKTRRDSLSAFLLHAASLPLPQPEIERTIRTVVDLAIQDVNYKQIVDTVRLLHRTVPTWTSDVDLVGIQALTHGRTSNAGHRREAFKLALKRLERGRELEPFPVATAKDLVRAHATSGRSSDEVANFHRLVLATQSSFLLRLEAHKKILAPLLRETLRPADHQLQTIVKVIAAARELDVREGHGFLVNYIGSFGDIYAKAKAQVGGDITRLNLTSSSAGSLLELVAAQEDQPRPKTSSLSRRPRMSLVEEFVQDLINAGDALEPIAIPRRQAAAARRILSESTGWAEASLLLEPFLEEPVEDEKRLEEAEKETSVSKSPEGIEYLSPETEGESLVEGEEVESAEIEQPEVIKIVQQVFDFEDAPWRYLIREGEGLVALLPTPPPPSLSPEPTTESNDLDDASPSLSSPQDEPSPSSGSSPIDSAPSLSTSKSSKPKSNSKRSVQLLDARLQTLLVNTTPDSAVASYHCLRDILATGHVPPFSLLSQVADSLGRRFEHQKVVEVVQLIEHVSEGGKVWDQSSAVRVHSEIISAFAYCRDLLSTEYHRTYLQEKMGARANSSAYGALIFNGEDSTGDASYAVKLWKEARRGNGSTHRHLYNGMMRALGKVGKAKEAVKMLASMREGRATPSWASYGFAIEACLQAGDLEKAKELYEQMQRETLSAPRRDFKPSILPFTSLMQHYATKQPDRDALLRIDGDLRDLDLLSHSLTYEVLIHAYGGIAPVDKNTMWEVIELLEANETQHAKIQGFHWAAVIRCLGVDDFDAAVATFEGIEARPSSFAKNPPLPDVPAYEAILEVSKSNDRQDIVEKYATQMESTLVASTAKADLLIKTYAELKDIESARRVFESTRDEPVDLVHPLRLDPSRPLANVSSPIYRLGSTWNAIIQAEFAQGNQEEAIALLTRMQATEWKPTQRPIATILQLGELLSVETNEEVETVEFNFASDLNAPQFINLESELAPPPEEEIVETEVSDEAEVVVVGEVVEEDASASKP